MSTFRRDKYFRVRVMRLQKNKVNNLIQSRKKKSAVTKGGCKILKIEIKRNRGRGLKTKRWIQKTGKKSGEGLDTKRYRDTYIRTYQTDGQNDMDRKYKITANLIR